jgi:hypothetical protein
MVDSNYVVSALVLSLGCGIEGGQSVRVRCERRRARKREAIDFTISGVDDALYGALMAANLSGEAIGEDLCERLRNHPGRLATPAEG